jgi:putative redox protein
MSDVIVKLNWTGGLRFTAINAGGHETAIDSDRVQAPSPVELLLEALGSCAAIDVITIMEKVRTPLESLEIHLDGDRHSPAPRYFTNVRMRFDAWGVGVNPAKLERAINLSVVKYCSVYHSLRPDIRFRAEFRIQAPGVDAAGDYQNVELSEPTSQLT